MTKEKHYRLLGIFPFLFWLGQGINYWLMDGLPHMLWMCNIGNLLLAIGIFFRIGWLARLAAIWLLPGVVIWLQYVVSTGDIKISSVFAHIGGLILGLYIFYKIGCSKFVALHAIIWYLVLQQFCRMFTPPSYNLNVAFDVHGGLKNTFSSYWKFWLTATMVVVVGMYILQFILIKIFPPRKNLFEHS